MIRIRWSPEAVDDLQNIVNHIRLDNPGAARKIVKTLYSGVESLKRKPSRGRPGRIDNTRELVFAPLPYIAVYRVQEGVVEVARIWHGARNRP